MLRSALILGSLVALVAAAGVIEGLRTNRWGPSGDLAAAAARLSGIPRQVGPCASTENPIEERILRRAEAVGSVSRVYTHAETGETVNVLFLCGPPGPIGAHTPDICYAGLGYEMVGYPQERTLALPDGTTVTYWSGRFEKEDGAALRVCWAWGVGGDWTAAEHPRREYALNDALYKLYATRGIPASTDEDTGPDPIERLLTDLLPEVRTALASEPE